MAIAQVKPEGITIYNMDEVGQETDKPVRVICHQIRDSIRPAIEADDDFVEAYTSVKEVVKDVEIHSDPEHPRILFVNRTLGETTLYALDVKKPEEAYDPEKAECGLECNGFGAAILNAYARVEYTSRTVGDLHMGILRIEHDNANRPKLN